MRTKHLQRQTQSYSENNKYWCSSVNPITLHRLQTRLPNELIDGTDSTLSHSAYISSSVPCSWPLLGADWLSTQGWSSATWGKLGTDDSGDNIKRPSFELCQLWPHSYQLLSLGFQVRVPQLRFLRVSGRYVNRDRRLCEAVIIMRESSTRTDRSQSLFGISDPTSRRHGIFGIT